MFEKEHWEFLVTHWGTPMTKVVSKKNKERRGNQTMMHTTGTKSFAHVSAEIEEDEGIQLSRADLFIPTHVNKDGKATDAAASELIVDACSFLMSSFMLLSPTILGHISGSGYRIGDCNCLGDLLS
ncbi:uncharacterized protein LOC132311319 isoform X2 [Cornus florida]|uniref:uncharacterized protein LOC132311319 isoform X2 n=1 Tax=Cornus florida TaxID=4283 RepID=UPI0028A16060|nr:uncharacterized protein LOC132311319 isoform X2 [Cornus florida]